MLLHLLNNRLRHLHRRSLTAEVGREHFPFFGDAMNGFADAIGGLHLADMLQHQYTGQDDRQRISDAFSRNIRRAAVDRFEDGVFVADICAGHKA